MQAPGERGALLTELRRGQDYEVKVRPYFHHLHGPDSAVRALRTPEAGECGDVRDGEGPWVPPGGDTLPASPPPTAPSAPPRAVSVAGNGTSVRISWQPPPLAEQNGVIRDYRVSADRWRGCGGSPLSPHDTMSWCPPAPRFGAWATRAASTSTRAWRGRCWRRCCGDWSPASLTVPKSLPPPAPAWALAAPLSPSASVSPSSSPPHPWVGGWRGSPRCWGRLLGTPAGVFPLPHVVCSPPGGAGCGAGGGEQRGRAFGRGGQAAGLHCWRWRRLLGHPRCLRRLALRPPPEEEGAEPLRWYGRSC